MTTQSTTYNGTQRFDKIFHTGQVLTIAGAHLVHDVYTSFLAPLLPLIIDRLNLSLALAGSLIMFQRLPSIINPFVGLLADRIDLRAFIVIAPGVTAVAMSLLGLAPSYAVLVLLLLITGLSSAAFHVPGPVMIARVSGNQVGKGMSFWMTGGELARTIGPLFAVGMVSLLTLEGSWPVMVIGITASVVIYFRIKDVPVRPAIQTAGSLGQTWRAMRHVLLPLTGIMLGRGFMAGALTSFLPTFIKSEGQSLWLGGLALALLEFAGAVGALSSGTLSDRLGRRRVLLVAMTTAPLLMLLFSVTRGWLMLPLLVLMGLTAFSTAPVVLAMIQDHAGDHPATANGLYMGISFVINAMLPFVVGWLADRVGLRTAFSWSAIVALTSLPIIYLLPRDA